MSALKKLCAIPSVLSGILNIVDDEQSVGLRMYLWKNADSGQHNYLYLIHKIVSSEEKSFSRHQSGVFCFNISKQTYFYFLLSMFHFKVFLF